MSNYTVEKSSDGRNWKTIRIIDAVNAAMTNQYNFVDSENSAGVSYYRIKMINSANSVSYSKIVTVNRLHSSTSGIHHNTIVTNTLHLQINGMIRDEYIVDYFMMSGSRIKQDRLQIHPGLNSTATNFPAELSRGIYLLVIKNKKGQLVHSARLIKN